MGSPSPSAAEERLAIGSVLDGRYRVDGLVGIGGMGSVYRSEHVGIGRPVAIKVLHADFIGNREASTRFQREAIASGRLDHPNIVGVSDFGLLQDGGCYLVMELLEGETLGARLERERIPWRDAIGILRGVLRGLRHAHDRGVVHRDIKPDNVFLAVKDGDPITKILDFGIAKLFAGATDDPAATRTGITVGTPAYLSPEQAVGGEITPASDLYSTTVLLFEMLTGRPPFDDKDPMSILGAHVGRPPPRVSDLAPELELPEALEELLQHGLAKTPASRIASANDYLRALADLLPSTLQAHGHGRASTASGRRTGSTPSLRQAAPRADGQPAPLEDTVEEELDDEDGGSAVPDSFDDTGALTVKTARAAQLASLPRRQVNPDATQVTPAPMPGAARQVSLADLGEPIPRSWLAAGGGAILLLFVLALLIAWRGDGSDGRDAPAPAPVAATATMSAANAALITEGLASRQRQINDALAILENAKECKDRKAALDELARLDDRRAAKPLDELRIRLPGKSAACLGADLAQVIKQLQKAPVLEPPPTVTPQR